MIDDVSVSSLVPIKFQHTSKHTQPNKPPTQVSTPTETSQTNKARMQENSEDFNILTTGALSLLLIPMTIPFLIYPTALTKSIPIIFEIIESIIVEVVYLHLIY